MVIGWGTGYDPLHVTPVFLRGLEDVSRLIWNPLCVQNLTGYLVKGALTPPLEEGKKIGICVRGCDSRSLVALIQEKLLSRESLHIFGIPCRGTLDVRRLMNESGLSQIRSVTIQGDHLVVQNDEEAHRFPLERFLARRCLRCRHPNPVIYDELVYQPITPRTAPEDAYRDVEAMEARSLQERHLFWSSELDRCIRCYACRNACPLCICQDRCIAETREPRWLTQRVNLPEKFLYHFIHALHLAGRCTECGECERVCPMEIPVTLIKEKLNQITRDLLHYEAGLDPEALPPLLTYNPNEAGI
ncbi:MAG: 4Fe-4S ferredoxin [Deltaproteobacteria bacterium]|nr:4Fe-4S ferredoxin [Deltaproteobacteria bacterium]